jgi:hypothetical protein
MKTCTKPGISFWDYPGARLGAENAQDVPYLPDILTSQPDKL